MHQSITYGFQNDTPFSEYLKYKRSIGIQQNSFSLTQCSSCIFLNCHTHIKNISKHSIDITKMYDLKQMQLKIPVLSLKTQNLKILEGKHILHTQCTCMVYRFFTAISKSSNYYNFIQFKRVDPKQQPHIIPWQIWWLSWVKIQDFPFSTTRPILYKKTLMSHRALAQNPIPVHCIPPGCAHHKHHSANRL